jgi:DNA-binding response OmpR family regulator
VPLRLQFGETADVAEAQNSAPTCGRLIRVGGPLRLREGDVITIGDATILVRNVTVGARTTETIRPLSVSPATNSRGLRVDARALAVFVGDPKLERQLSAQEFKLRNYLYEKRDRVCSRQELGDLLWGAERWDPNMLHRLVHRLKAKLEPGVAASRYIETVPWMGYRLHV